MDKTARQDIALQDLRFIKDYKPKLEKDGFTYVSGRHVENIENMEDFSKEQEEALKQDSIKLVKKM